MTSKVGYQPKIVLGQLDWAGSVADPAPPTTPLMVAAAAGQADAADGLDIAIDGADQFTPDTLDLIKGFGRCALREMVVDGLVGIANGDNPRIIESRLQGYAG